MSLIGLGARIVRSINRKLKNYWKQIRGQGYTEGDEGPDEIPPTWVKEAPGGQKVSTGQKVKSELIIKKGKVVAIRKVHRVPWLRNFKRGLAAVLLLLNFVISQFLMVSQGAAIAFLFFGNVFILVDYLWKTRRVD